MALQSLSSVLRNRFLRGSLFCLAFMLALRCGATPGALYQNLGSLQFYSPPTILNPLNSPPQIDDTAFDNEGIFEVNFMDESLKAILYETSDTLDYTNGDSGVMIANAPIATNMLTGNLENFQSYGAGFQFDDKTSSGHQMASVFYNSGTIRCNSILDGNNTYNFGGEFGSIYLLETIGQCYINASNVYNPGAIDLGVDSLMQVTGNHVDLSRSTLTIEPELPLLNLELLNNNAETFYDNLNIVSVGAAGVDTNGDWNPGGPAFYNQQLYPLTLSSTNAISSEPEVLALTNSLSYFRIDADATGTNLVVRAVFVQNESPDAPYYVYLQPENSPLAGGGTAYVEWTGIYQDPATGDTLTNYLYLQNDYQLGASTNVQVFPGPGNVGYPDNFTFYNPPTPLPLTGALTPTFPTGIFNDQSITNPYAYMNGQIVASTVGTNVSVTNPNGGITNQYGRIQISAATELNLANAVISGQNYLSIQATNQFDGSAGSYIASPFSDINIGVTNGSSIPMTVSNLLVSDIPNWSGNIQAWSTRWTNSTGGFNIDYRVLLVYSQLNPISQPWVQNLNLRTGTNALVISDDLNVYGSLFTDAKSLTISTNGYGYGATSSQGTLYTLFSGNLGPSQMPNLRWLTNDGVIGSQNLLILTNANHYGAVINNGAIIDAGTTIYATNFLNSGAISNGVGNLNVISQTTTLTNGSIYAGGNVSIAANNLSVSNAYIQCLSLTLNPAQSVTDFHVPGNIWVVGNTNSTGGQGFALLNNPTNGDLLGTTITNICPPPNKKEANTWSGRDFGAVNAGFTNNSALGHLILDTAGANSLITFNGTGSSSNALYVDCLELQGSITNGLFANYNFANWLSLNPNITIYFAQALISGVSVAEQIDQASVYSGKNGGYITNVVTVTHGVTTTNIVVVPGRLRWVPTYAGLFSSTNIVVNGVTNTYNAALAESKDIDSDGSGTANVNNPSPFFTAQQINFTLTVTNQPTRAAVLSWNTVPLATNSVYFTSTLLTNNWQLFTNFLSTNVLGPSYVTTVTDTNILKGTRFYKVLVQPWLTYPY